MFFIIFFGILKRPSLQISLGSATGASTINFLWTL